MAQKILLVEDEQLIREMYSTVLTGAGFEVDQAEDGKKAVKKLIRPNVDYNLVLLDIMLPMVDGISILRQAKAADSPAKNIPVMMLTNLGLDDVINEAKSLGAIKCIIKSSTLPQQILDEVKNFLADGGQASQPANQTPAQTPSNTQPTTQTPSPATPKPNQPNSAMPADWPKASGSNAPTPNAAPPQIQGMPPGNQPGQSAATAPANPPATQTPTNPATATSPQQPKQPATQAPASPTQPSNPNPQPGYNQDFTYQVSANNNQPKSPENQTPPTHNNKGERMPPPIDPA